MDIIEAYRILGASRSDDENTIKKKYKRLLFVHHPDAKRHRGEASDDGMITKVIEAYKVIRENLELELESSDDWEWEAAVNEEAFCDRAVYVQYRIYDDEDLPLSKVAEGKYFWDPDLEDFPFFAKSVLEAAKDVVSGAEGTLSGNALMEVFHLMMQEYVLPADAARKIGEPVGGTEAYQFAGYIKCNAGKRDDAFHEGEPVDIFLSDNRAVAQNPVTGVFLGDISFDDDALYYVILPLLEESEVEISSQMMRLIKTGRNKNSIMLRIVLKIPKELKDIPVSYKRQILDLLGM
ncbi:J domain-containing protein [Butyrivibrio sp. WCD3002]|uniref:J domain-containing protein n=1 Tax=Butyrivibrio sp. WCD3002 TaxID=1280676 RepID=UPI000402A1FC|nr:J domain-containing protein [Butyrivibrio sp. WCD3002]